MVQERLSPVIESDVTSIDYGRVTNFVIENGGSGYSSDNTKKYMLFLF